MGIVDWLAFGAWIALLVVGWKISVNPKGRTSQEVRKALEQYDKVSVRFEKRRNKRGK